MRKFVTWMLLFFFVTFFVFPSWAQGVRRVSQDSDRPEEIEPPPASYRTYEEFGEEGEGEVRGAVPTKRAARAGMGVLYQIHILGSVMSPSTLRLPPSTRLAEAIKFAGGVAYRGSKRNIEVRKKGKKTRTYDLQKFYLDGDIRQNPYLNENDVIYVPTAERVIEVQGAVRRPDVYELKNERTLAQVIDMVDGFSASAALKVPIRIVRYEDGKKRVLSVNTNKASMEAFKIKSGDIVYVPNVITKDAEFDYNVVALPGEFVFYPSYENRIFVIGGVRTAGAYDYSPHYTVDNYLSLAGGLSERGADKFKIRSADGRVRKAKGGSHVNPGDTIIVKQHWLAPIGWVSFGMSLASFGLSTTATVLALTR